MCAELVLPGSCGAAAGFIVPVKLLSPGALVPKRAYDGDAAFDLYAAEAATLAPGGRAVIGTGIALLTQRDPIVTAKVVSTLDQLSNGRFLFGVGNGWNQDEVENHGTVFASRHKLARERIEAMKAIWTQEEPEYHGEFVNFDKMKQWPKPKQAPHPPIIVGGAFPYAARRAIRYGNGWIPRADRIEKDGIGAILDKFRMLAKESGRDPAELPISIFRVPDVLDQLKVCQEIGVDRVTFSLPAEKADKLMPIIDRWSELQRQLNG